MSGQVAAASQAPRGGTGTAGGSGVSRPTARPPVLQLRPGAQLTSGLKASAFAGYATTPSTLASANATIKIPLLSCAASGDTGISPGVWLTGLATSYSGAAGLLFC